jgi:hypothetical protein
MKRTHTVLAAALLLPALAHAQSPQPVPLSSAFVSTSGVFPALTAAAPGAKRSESGHGALMAWAGSLWALSYLSVPDAGSGTGLFRIDANMVQQQVAFHNSTYANRLMIPGLQSIVIGPYVIDLQGNVRVLEQLLSVRVGGMAEHIFFPETRAYFLGMDGPLWDCDLVALNCTQLFDLVKELDIPAAEGEQPHFKAAHTMSGTLWVASNTFEESDALGSQHGGRLATWTGRPGDAWTILERTAFTEVTGRHNFGKVVFALGWDDKSVILKVLDNGDGAENAYPATTYRLPKASHAYDHLWTTEWPRIREVETERYLMDMHGTWFELPPLAWGGAVWGIKPIAQHLRMVPDFCSWRGFLVLGGNQVSSIFDNNWITGESQSGLWLGKTDDLWQLGKPQGWGAVWLNEPVTTGQVSDPYLMTGYDKKTAHVTWDQGCVEGPGTAIALDVDFAGNAGHVNNVGATQRWSFLAAIALAHDGQFDAADTVPSAHYAFEPGFSAHWVRARFIAPPTTTCNVTVWFTYS